MGKTVKRMAFCGLLSGLIWVGAVFSGRELRRPGTFLDSVTAGFCLPEDRQALQDAVSEALRQNWMTITDVQRAGMYAKDKFPLIRDSASRIWKELDCIYVIEDLREIHTRINSLLGEMENICRTG